MDNSYKDDYILVILSCKKYRDVRRKGQIKQFLNDNSILKGMRWFHVEGNEALFKHKKYKGKDYIVNEKYNIIYTNTGDDYLTLAHKTIMAFKAIYENYSFKYLIKTDDDQRLIYPKLFDMMHEKFVQLKPDYVGRIFNMQRKLETYQPRVHKVDGFPEGYIVGDGLPFTNGRLYALSHRNTKDLVENKFEQIKSELSEDWAIAKYQEKEYRTNIFSFETMHVFMDFEPYNKKFGQHT
jgi:hypothetical protein